MTAPTEAAKASINIDSIKEIMDGFDPASILPDINNIVGITNQIARWSILIAPAILILLGIGYLLLAPREANHYFGYKTYFGMGSVRAWRFTQRLAGAILGGTGAILMLVMFAISGRLLTMDAMDAVWKAISCLIWEGAAALIAMFLINLIVLIRFNRKGEVRKEKQ